MANYDNFDDKTLIDKISEREDAALVVLYQRHAKSVFNVAYYVLQNRTLAEEVTQDVFFLVWQHPRKWDAGKGNLGSWLMSVTRFMAIDRLRHEKSRRQDGTQSLEELADHIASKGALNTPEDSVLLRTLLKRLPKDQREVLMLSYFRGLTQIEIAQRLNVPEGTIKSRLRLSLEKLREWWHEAINEHQ